jgi:hypothetical protein
MKTYSRAAILFTCLLTIAAGTGNTPLTSEHANHAILMADGSGPIQTCRPGTNCDPGDNLQIADGSGPIQTCRPGTNCDPGDNLQTADGSGPIQTCRPGTNCDPGDNLQLADGSGPIQTCRPGASDDTVRLAILPATSRPASYTGV